MKLTFYRVHRLLSKKSERSRQHDVCKRLHFELPFHINELALYKFILERQSNSPLEHQYFLGQFNQIREQCLKFIQELDHTTRQLNAVHCYDAQTYLTQYQAHSVVQKTTSVSQPKSLAYLPDEIRVG